MTCLLNVRHLTATSPPPHVSFRCNHPLPQCLRNTRVHLGSPASRVLLASLRTSGQLCVSDYSAADLEPALLRSVDVRKRPWMTRDARPVQEVCQSEDPIVFRFPQVLRLRPGLQESSERGGKLRAIRI